MRQTRSPAKRKPGASQGETTDRRGNVHRFPSGLHPGGTPLIPTLEKLAAATIGRLEDVRKIRNHVVHFREGELTAAERQLLADTARFVATLASSVADRTPRSSTTPGRRQHS